MSEGHALSVAHIKREGEAVGFGLVPGAAIKPLNHLKLVSATNSLKTSHANVQLVFKYRDARRMVHVGSLDVFRILQQLEPLQLKGLFWISLERGAGAFVACGTTETQKDAYSALAIAIRSRFKAAGCDRCGI